MVGVKGLNSLRGVCIVFISIFLLKLELFIGYMKNSKLPCNIQKSEVSQFKWMNLEDSIQSIRPYNLERIQILKNIQNVLLKYSLIS